MPLFMDRHDLPGVTAEQAAQAHLQDVAMEAKHGVRFLSYWFDADRDEVFCLASAPASETMVVVHQEAHGMVPNEIISVSEDNVLRFLGRIGDPVDADQDTSPFRAILFTDLQGSTALLQAVGEAEFMVLLTEHDLIIRRALVKAHGREVKHTGDGIMASFDDVGHALACAIAIQDGFADRIRGGASTEMRVRVGIAAGQPVDRDGDLFGSTVTLASRLCDASEPGHVLTSDVVRERGVQHGFAFDEGTDRQVKGFDGLIRVFELVSEAQRGRGPA